MARLQPLFDRIVVKRVESANNPKSLIIRPDITREKPQEGEVLAVGPGRERDTMFFSDEPEYFEMPVKVGDRVLFGKYNGTEVELDGEELLIMHASDVFAVIQTAEEPAEKKKAAKR
jgi:chaperonin GroES